MVFVRMRPPYEVRFPQIGGRCHQDSRRASYVLLYSRNLYLSGIFEYDTTVTPRKYGTVMYW